VIEAGNRPYHLIGDINLFWYFFIRQFSLFFFFLAVHFFF